jgi:Plasmid pRiA4b ORF-3-like protein
VANTRRPRTQREHRHLSLVPDTGLADGSDAARDVQPSLWDAHELRRLTQLRRLALDTDAPQEAVRLIDNATTAEDAIEQLSAAGLLPDEAESFEGMLSWFTPLLEPGCDQVEAEIAGGGFISELRRAAPADVSVADVLADVMPQLARHPCAEALAMARVLAAVGPAEIRPVAASVADQLAADGQTDMPWAAGLGQPKPERFFGYGDIFGDQQSVVSVFSYGRTKHAVVVLIDYLLGGGVKDCYLVEYTGALREEYRAAGHLPGLRFGDYDAATVRTMLESALARQPCPVEPDQIEDVWSYIDVLRARLDLLPRPAGSESKPVSGPADKQPALRHGPQRNVHRLKVTLRGTKPPIWRRFEVPSDITLKRLHTVIQLAFGWHDSHLFVFDTPAGQYGSYDPDLQIRSAAGQNLSAVADWPGDKVRYEYDFGDRWELDILVEAVHPAEPGVAYPRCTAGRRAGPPEDCGGTPGYYELLNVLANPRHRDHAAHLHWLGIESAAEFDPAAFEAEVADRKLRRHARVLIKP